MTRRQAVYLFAMFLAVRVIWITWINPVVPVTDRVFGKGCGEILQDADRVEIYRLGHLVTEAGAIPKRISEYEVTAGPEKLSETNSRYFGNLLSDRAAYRPGNWRACEFDPEVRLDFIRGNETIQVVLCFDCTFLYAYRNGTRVGGENFENARPTLVQLLKPLFPNDASMQSLTEYVKLPARR
jgi:hypothetical protein